MGANEAGSAGYECFHGLPKGTIETWDKGEIGVLLSNTILQSVDMAWLTLPAADQGIYLARRILITGVTGFLGRHLALALSRSSTVEVFGVARGEARLAQPELPCHWLPGDLTDPMWAQQAVRTSRPTHCYHLAGQSRESASWSNPWQTYDANLHCQLNLLEALVSHAPDCRTLIASSSAVYGFMSGTSLHETDPLDPVSPYGVSKAGQDLMARQYAVSHDLPAIVARNFNILGPGQSASFAFSSFALQVAQAERGEQPPLLETGNLKVARDFLDVQDLLAAWDLVMEKGTPGTAYNVGSGSQHKLHVVVKALLEQAAVPMRIKSAPHRTRARATDPPVLRADISRLRALGPWQPQIPLAQTLADILEYWRAN